MNKPSILFLISNDTNTKILANEVLAPFNRDQFYIVGDSSVSLSKIIRLLRKRRIKFFWLLKQLISSYVQKFILMRNVQCTLDNTVKSNDELADIIRKHPEIKTLIAFRGGLLVKENILSNVNCINVHYARLPDYIGLGSISNALKNKDYKQEATIHIMEKSIDTGSTILTEPYLLEPSKPYWKNELIASKAGVVAAQKYIKSL